MIDFEIARKEAFDGISETNTIIKTQKKIKSKYGYPKSEEIWEVIVEIPINDKIRDFRLLFELKPDFPLSIPEISLSEEDYETIKYIPHVDDKRNICLFDQENIKIDSNRPKYIAKACIERAKEIIINGLQKTNLIDFKDEIVAYWNNTYNVNEIGVAGGYLGEGVSELLPGKLIVYNLSPSYDKTNIFFGSDNDESKKILDFFKMHGHNLKKQQAFYLGIVSKIEPPFFFTNNSILSFIDNNFATYSREIKSYLNESLDSKILIFSLKVNEELVFFGFNIVGFKNTQNGWRKGSLSTVKIMSSIQGAAAIQRISFKYFSFKRIRKRTDGISPSFPLKIMVSGLGSIGSNLLFYLSCLEISDLLLVDPDILQLENINRHLLSFHEVGENKVDAIAKYMIFNNPFLNIEKYSLSVVDVIEKNLSSINNMDILFCAIGKDSIENYIIQCLASNKIEKPVIFLWVEPYMIGAHALYINPNTNFKLTDLELENYYKFNIISELTYKNPENNLLLKEAGCQSSYIPYGKESIARFFAAFLPDLFNLIKNRPVDNLAFTYFGDFDIALSCDLEISTFAKSHSPGQLIKQII